MKLLRLEQETWAKFDHPVELAVCAITREEWEAANHTLEPIVANRAEA